MVYSSYGFTMFNKTVGGWDGIVYNTSVENGKFAFEKPFLDDTDGSYAFTNSPPPKNFQNDTGILGEKAPVTVIDAEAAPLGDDGAVNAFFPAYLLAVDANNDLDIYRTGFNPQGPRKVDNDGVELKFGIENVQFAALNETQTGADMMIAQFDASKNKVEMTRVLLDDETGSFEGAIGVGGTGNVKNDFNQGGGISELVDLDASAVGSAGFVQDHAWLMTIRDDAGNVDLYTVEQDATDAANGKRATLVADDLDFVDNRGHVGTKFLLDEGSTKVEMLNETQSGADGMIVHVAELNNDGRWVEDAFVFTRLLVDDETGGWDDVIGVGNSVVRKRAYVYDKDDGYVTGAKTRMDIDEIINIEANAVGSEGFNPNAAYAITTLDRAGNVDLYHVDKSGQKVWLVEDNMIMAPLPDLDMG